MQMTEKSVNIAAGFFMVTGSVVVEPIAVKIPIALTATKIIIVLNVVIVLIIQMICVKTAVNA